MEQPENLAEEFHRESQHICALILNPEVELVDVAIRVNAMRERCREEAPDQLELFEAIYVGRFNRLWHQWRCVGEDRPPEHDTWPWLEEAFF